MKGVAGHQSKSLRSVSRVEKMKIRNGWAANKLKISTINIAFMEWFEGKLISLFRQIYHVESGLALSGQPRLRFSPYPHLFHSTTVTQAHSEKP